MITLMFQMIYLAFVIYYYMFMAVLYICGWMVKAVFLVIGWIITGTVSLFVVRRKSRQPGRATVSHTVSPSGKSPFITLNSTPALIPQKTATVPSYSHRPVRSCSYTPVRNYGYSSSTTRSTGYGSNRVWVKEHVRYRNGHYETARDHYRYI